jgi:excisionase family DNA binding protein
MLKEDLLAGAKGAADYTGESPRAIYHLVENGQLPCIRKGRKLYFRKSELEAAFRSEGASTHSTIHDPHSGASSHSTLRDREVA